MNKVLILISLISITIISCVENNTVSNPCADIFCENGGICVEDTCVCEPWFEGEFCEKEFREQFYGTYKGVMITSTQGAFIDTFDTSISFSTFPEDVQKIIWDSIHYLIFDGMDGHFTIPGQPSNPQTDSKSTISGYGSIKNENILLIYNYIFYPGLCPETMYIFTGVKSD